MKSCETFRKQGTEDNRDRWCFLFVLFPPVWLCIFASPLPSLSLLLSSAHHFILWSLIVMTSILQVFQLSPHDSYSCYDLTDAHAQNPLPLRDSFPDSYRKLTDTYPHLPRH